MTTRTIYFIAPADQPTDQYAAGFDGNFFASEAAAEAALPALAAALASDPDDWTVESRESIEADAPRLIGPEWIPRYLLSEEGCEYETVAAADVAEALEIAKGNVDRSNYDAPGTLMIEVRAVNVDDEDDCDEAVVVADEPEPDCEDELEHDWRSPLSVVGGIAENPGVWGKGGGVIIREVCAHCGRYRVTDTWAQNANTGQEGYTSVGYEAATPESLAWVDGRRKRSRERS